MCCLGKVSGSLSLQQYEIISNTVNDVLAQGSATGHNYTKSQDVI